MPMTPEELELRLTGLERHVLDLCTMLLKYSFIGQDELADYQRIFLRLYVTVNGREPPPPPPPPRDPEIKPTSPEGTPV